MIVRRMHLEHIDQQVIVDKHVAILVSRFHQDITERLLTGAQDFFAAQKNFLPQFQCSVHWVPGAYELPQAAAILLQSAGTSPDAIVALGAVIRGETPHFDYVCQSTTRSLMQLAIDCRIPITLGVITADNREQALARAATSTFDHAAIRKTTAASVTSNKGYEAAQAAWEMVRFKMALQQRA